MPFLVFTFSNWHSHASHLLYGFKSPQNGNNIFEAEMEKVYWEQEIEKSLPLDVNFYKEFTFSWCTALSLSWSSPFSGSSTSSSSSSSTSLPVHTCINPPRGNLLSKHFFWVCDNSYWWWLPCLCNQWKVSVCKCRWGHLWGDMVRKWIYVILRTFHQPPLHCNQHMAKSKF